MNQEAFLQCACGAGLALEYKTESGKRDVSRSRQDAISLVEGKLPV